MKRSSFLKSIIGLPFVAPLLGKAAVVDSIKQYPATPNKSFDGGGPLRVGDHVVMFVGFREPYANWVVEKSWFDGVYYQARGTEITTKEPCAVSWMKGTKPTDFFTVGVYVESENYYS